jgi:hypothetical protein
MFTLLIFFSGIIATSNGIFHPIRRDGKGAKLDEHYESSIIITILGSESKSILADRLHAFSDYYDERKFGEQQNDPIIYLTGGSKFSKPFMESEAQQMFEYLEFMGYHNIYLDTEAKNTAENFMNLFDFINGLDYYIDEIVVVTSQFHKTRAEKLFYGFFNKDVAVKWVLAPLSCASCAIDESVHIKNVDTDIEKAQKRYLRGHVN